MLWAMLLLSIAGLALGPLLVAVGRAHRAGSGAIDGLTLGVVPVLIVVRLLPHAYDEIGFVAVACAVAGFALVAFAHRAGHGVETRVGHALVLPTLAIHALADGAGLALSVSSKSGSAGFLLAAAIVVHRLPEGLFIASTSVPVLGWRRTLLRIGILAGATCAGAAAGHELLEVVPDGVFEGVVAFGLGAMLRMITHQHHPNEEESAGARAASGVACVAGVVLALAVPAPGSVLSRAQPRELPIVQSLGPLFVETAPALLAGLALAAIARKVAPQLRPFATYRAAATTRQLLLVAPTGVAVAWAVGAAPLSIDALPLAARMFGAPLAAVYVAGAIVAAVVASRVVPRLGRDSESTATFGGDAHGPGPSNVDAPVDAGAAFYLAGLVGAAALEAALDPRTIARLPRGMDVLAAIAIGMPIPGCAAFAIPIAAVLVHKGVSLGAAIAFVAAASFDVAILGALRSSIGARAAAACFAIVVAAAAFAGLAANALVTPASVPQIHPLVAHAHHPVEWVAACALAAFVFVSLVRRGARGFVSTLAPAEAPHAHAHEPAEVRG